MPGTLFSRDFLTEGITETPEWAALDDETIAVFRQRVRSRFEAFPAAHGPDEAQTEEMLVEPVLEALGWEHYRRQPKLATKGRSHVPDYLLFADQDAKTKAAVHQDAAAFRYGRAIVEAKRWNRDLDRGTDYAALDGNPPSSQIIRYLSRADIHSEKAVQWGVLTNGRTWRLYWQGARSRSEEFFQLDLAAAVGVAGTQSELAPIIDALSRRQHKSQRRWINYRDLAEAFAPRWPGRGTDRKGP